MKKLFQFLFFTFFIFTLTLTTFSCANIIDALKEAFPPPGKSGENIQNENTEPNKPNDVVDDEQDKNPETEKPNDVVDDEQDENTEPEKPNTDGNNQGSSSGDNTGNKYETITKIASGNAGININLTGINSDLYYVLCEGTEKPYSQQENLFMFDTVENEEFEVRLSLYRKDNNEYFTSTFSTLKDGEQKDVIVEIAKYNVEVVINGDYSKYENPKISVNPIREQSDRGEFDIYNINEKNITVFYITSNHGVPTSFILFNDIDNDDTIIYRDWNGNDYDLSLRTSATYKDNNTMDAIVSLDILESINLLDESQIILYMGVEYNPSDETTKYFRFEQRSDTKWTFIVPIGMGSDGEFITCYFCENNLGEHSSDHLWNLLKTIGVSPNREFYFELRNQTTEWYNYIKQIIAYLQDEKGLTVNNIPDFLQD